MLLAVAFLLSVTFTLHGDPIETNIEELNIDWQTSLGSYPEVVDFSKIDLEMLRDEYEVGEPPKQMKSEVPRNKKGQKKMDRAGGPKTSSTTTFEGDGQPEGRSKMPRKKNHVGGGKAHPQRPGKPRPHRTRPQFSPPAIHLFDVTTAEGSTIRIDEDNFPFAKTFLIVNTATGREYAQQWQELEQLYQDWHFQGLEIIAFPSNSFNQEPLDDDEIQRLVKDTYKITFPVMAKCEVTGDYKHALYDWLTEWAGRDGKVPEWAPLEKSGLKRSDVQWNFEKFLVYNRRNDQLVLRFPYDSSPLELSEFVERAIIVNEGVKIEL